MKPEVEIKLLQRLLKEVDNPKALQKPSWLREFPLWIAVFVITICFFYLFGTTSWPHTFLILVFFVLGMLTMLVILKRQAAGNWPVLKQFVDISSVESRLRELGG